MTLAAEGAGPAPERSALDSDLAGRVARDVVGSAGATAAALFVAVGLLLPGSDRDLSAWAQSAEELVLAALLLPAGYVYLRRMVAGRLAWARDGRQPSIDEAAAVLEAPSRIAMHAICLWTAISLGAFAWNVADKRFEQSLVDELFNASSVLLAGFTFAGVAFLVADRRLRPGYSAALAIHPPVPRRGVRLRSRLLLSWGLGSGIPVLIIIVLIAWRPATDLNNVIAFLAVTTLAAGGAFARATARVIAEPLATLQARVAEVGHGNLGATVEVDDATEIGYLQGLQHHDCRPPRA